MLTVAARDGVAVAPHTMPLAGAPNAASHGGSRSAAGAAQRIHCVNANATIYSEGDRENGLYTVEFGTVRLCRLLADGRRQIGSFHFAGEVFGLEPAASRSFSAEAVEASGIRRLQDGQVAALSSDRLLAVALQNLGRAQEHLLVVGRQNAAERVASFLSDVRHRQGDTDELVLSMPRADIADYLGLTIETISRIFSRLREQGVIRLSGARKVRILNPRTLDAMCA